MKQIKTLLLAAILMIGASSFVNAQSKVAHINTQELIAMMPKMKNAENELKKISATYDNELKGMYTELQTKMQKYQNEAQTQTEDENIRRTKEVEQFRVRIQEYQASASQELQKKKEDLIKPIFEEARKTIHEVAKSKGYDYVLDSTLGGGVILADGYDLLNDVKSKLGI